MNILKRILFVLCSLSFSLPVYCIEYSVRFYDEICIQPYSEYNYLTCHDIHVAINDEILIIPKNFETDLASIPRIFWPIMNPSYSEIMGPAILHDFLYHNPLFYSRYDSDLIFYDAMINNDMGIIESNIVYFSVRIFGGNHYYERA